MINLTYQHLLHDVALRMNALVGGDVTAASTTYDNEVLDVSHFKSADWPFNSFRDAILMAVEDFSWAVADTGGHPWRALFASTTPPLPNHAELPTTSSSLREIIGIWGAVYDSTDDNELTEQPLDVIRRAAQETWRKYPLYYFKIDGGRITHTRQNVTIECCVFSQNDELTKWASNGKPSLPDVLRPAIMARAIALMTKDGAFEGQAAIYRGYSDEALARIRAGLTTLPAKTLPSPTVSQT